MLPSSIWVFIFCSSGLSTSDTFAGVGPLVEVVTLRRCWRLLSCQNSTRIMINAQSEIDTAMAVIERLLRPLDSDGEGEDVGVEDVGGVTAGSMVVERLILEVDNAICESIDDVVDVFENRKLSSVLAQ